MAEQVTLKISAQWDELNRTLTQSSKAIDDWSKRNMGGFSSMAQSLGTLALRFAAMVGPIAAAGAAIYGIAQKTANAGDELYDMSKRTGIAVESLSGLKYAAELSGSSLEGVAVGLKFLGRNMVDAKNGTGEAKDAFKALGISVTDSTGKLVSTEEVFLQLSDKFKGMEDGAGKTALAMQIFGRSGSDLIPLLNEGGDGIRKMTEEAEKAGLIFSKEAAEGADQFNDNITRLKGNLTGFIYQISNELMPVMNRLMETGLFGAPKATDSERARGLKQQIDHINDALIRLYETRKKGGDKEFLDKQIKQLWAQKNALQGQVDAATKTNEVKKEPPPAIPGDKAKSLKTPEIVSVAGRQFYKETIDFLASLDSEYAKKKEASLKEEAALIEDLHKMEMSSAEDYAKWQDEEIKKRAQARESEIQYQLSIIDLKEKEFSISPIAATNERIRLQEELLRIQEGSIAGLDKAANPASWYAQANAIQQTREALLGLSQTLREQTGAIFEGFKYGLDDFVRNAQKAFQIGQELARTTAQAMSQSFEDFFFDAFEGRLKSFKDYFTSFLKNIQQALAKVLAQQVAMGMVSGISGLFSSTSMTGTQSSYVSTVGRRHNGGIVMHSGGLVPRFHSGGLASDEVPAILQRGEYVVSRRGVAALDSINNGQAGGGVNVSVNVINQSSQPVNAKVGGSQFDGRQYVIGVVLDDIERGGPLRNAMGGR